MKLRIRTSPLFLLPVYLCGEVFYVSPDGNNNAAGTLEDPFRTIQAAIDQMSPGDSCLIRGGTYRETVKVGVSNVTLRNYPDEWVSITGTDIVTGWTLYRDHIYMAPFSGMETQFTQVFMDGQYAPMARYPDNVSGKMLEPRDFQSGYGRCIAYAGDGATRRVKFPDMPSAYPDDQWKGGYFRGITGAYWANPMGTISGSSGGEFTVTPLSTMWMENHFAAVDYDGSGEGWGFILHLNALDSEGEWYCQDNTLYCYPPGGSMENVTVEAQKRAWAIRMEGVDGIALKGLHIRGAGIYMNNVSDCLLDHCSMQYMIPFYMDKGYAAKLKILGGLYLNGNNNEIKNSYIAHTWGHGIAIDGGSGNRIFNCYLEDIGWLARILAGVYNFGYNTTIERCTFGSAGRTHVRSQSRFNIRYCELFDCMRMGQDAGSIQGVGVHDMEGSEIAYNVVHDCNALPWTPRKQFVVAFYLEDCGNYVLHHNIAHSIKTDVLPDGAFLYMGPRRDTISNCQVYNNTTWNMDHRIRVWNRDSLGHIEDARFCNNIFQAELENDYGTPSLEGGFDFRNNVEIPLSFAGDNFRDAAAGDFRLEAGSPAIDSGMAIAGITDGYKGPAPDAGALEDGEPMWEYGANIDPKEMIPPDSLHPVDGIHIKQDSLQLLTGNREYLTATLTPFYATNREVTWESRDPAVAGVSSGGLVTALSPGSAWILAGSTDPSHKDSCFVSVMDHVPVRVSGIEVTPDTLVLDPGEISTLMASVFPADADNKSVHWATTVPYVVDMASVTGIVKGLYPGTTTAVATTDDEGFRDSCIVIVRDPNASTGMRLLCGPGIREEIQVIPNPVHASFRITGASDVRMVQIMRVTGEIIQQVRHPDLPEGEILIGNIPEGIYFARVICAEGHFVFKIFIQ